LKLLLDTHAVVWWLSAPEALSAQAFAALGDKNNQILVSAVCGYEIEIKRNRDAALRRVPDSLHDAILAQDFAWLPIQAEHAITAALLPAHHRDPWDRILVAQAMDQDAVLVSCDTQVKAYGVPTLW
jgi:PIN domain nuclease of toxin-antitoxin system